MKHPRKRRIKRMIKRTTYLLEVKPTNAFVIVCGTCSFVMTHAITEPTPVRNMMEDAEVIVFLSASIRFLRENVL